MCKPCDTAAHKRYYEKNKRKVTSARLVSQYGIDIDTFEAMRFLQDNLCKLCGQPESVKDRELAVDHDHATGEVRGLLCFKCNTALGRVADDVESAKKVLAYITGEACQ